MTETKTEEVEGLTQALRRKISRPLTEELRRAYYQHMAPELQKQWNLLALEKQDAILEMLEEYHQMVEHELWHFLSRLIQVLYDKGNQSKTEDSTDRLRRNMRQFTHQQSREMSREETERFLKKHSYGRLGLAFQNEPYVVPVAYGYDQGKIYFHSARQGKKLDFIKRNDRVCFEVDEWQKAWASVLCYGTIALRDDLEAKRKCFELLTGQALDENRLQCLKVYVGVISLEEITGRCSTDFEFTRAFSSLDEDA